MLTRIAQFMGGIDWKPRLPVIPLLLLGILATHPVFYGCGRQGYRCRRKQLSLNLSGNGKQQHHP